MVSNMWPRYAMIKLNHKNTLPCWIPLRITAHREKIPLITVSLPSTFRVSWYHQSHVKL